MIFPPFLPLDELLSARQTYISGFGLFDWDAKRKANYLNDGMANLIHICGGCFGGGVHR